MNEEERKKLDEQLEQAKEAIYSLNKKKFLDDSTYNWTFGQNATAIEKNPLEEMKNYYREILEKINLSAVSLLIRTIEWGKGFFDAIELDNWLSAAASLRGAMESADRKSTRLNSSHSTRSRMPSSA